MPRVQIWEGEPYESKGFCTVVRCEGWGTGALNLKQMKSPYRSYLYKVAEKESESMDINEPSLMDVAHLNDTREGN